MTEHEFNRKWEIEAKMADDKEREAKRVAQATEMSRAATSRPMTTVIRRVATQGAVKRPLTPRIGRGF